MMSDLEPMKQQAAERALAYVRSGMALGLGTGSTARYVVLGLGERLRDGRLHSIVGVATSEATATLAAQAGVPIATLEQQPKLDLAIDGADEIDPELNLIKGLGGALLREKIVESAAERLIIVADETKPVAQLGTRSPLPVEIIRMALPVVLLRLKALGCTPTLRQTAHGQPFLTDEHNYILDCAFQGIADAHALDTAIHAIPGVVEHGLFIGMASLAIIAGSQGISTLVRPGEPVTN
ncbi:MAG TPA: ribose-5-phosphate isomerase RpiA [Kouleothrix sp.]|nr:ribose-5-phosphate isomerase RpiA [Kouleothrix sp.]